MLSLADVDAILSVMFPILKLPVNGPVCMRSLMGVAEVQGRMLETGLCGRQADAERIRMPTGWPET